MTVNTSPVSAGEALALLRAAHQAQAAGQLAAELIDLKLPMLNLARALAQRLDDENIRIGPAEYVPWQKDNKIAFVRLEGSQWGGVAVNRATDGVIVALPGSTQNVRVTEPQQIQPTLKVKHGTSVSVFVARDLDFSTVDR